MKIERLLKEVRAKIILGLDTGGHLVDVAKELENILGINCKEPSKVLLVETAYHPPEVTFCVDGVAMTYNFETKVAVQFIAATALNSSVEKAWRMAKDSAIKTRPSRIS